MYIDYKKQNRQLAIFKMLANANRLKILKAIIAAPNKTLNVSDISRQLKLALPKVSDHLKLLRIHKIVKAKQTGTIMEYSINEPSIIKLLNDIG